MQKTTCTLLFIFIVSLLQAQTPHPTQGTIGREPSIFSPLTEKTNRIAPAKEELDFTKATFCAIQQEELLRAFKSNASPLTLQIPKGGGENFTLVLRPSGGTPEIAVQTDAPTQRGDDNPRTPGKHYWGEIKGMEGRSLAAISIYEDKIYGLISDEHTNYSLVTSLPTAAHPTPQVALIADADLTAQGFSCNNPPQSNLPNLPQDTQVEDRAPGDKIVRISYQIAYATYQSFGSFDACLDYVDALLKASQFLFFREGVFVRTLEIYINTNPDAYSINDDEVIFDALATQNKFKGDLVVLIGGFNGAALGIGRLCGTREKFAKSPIDFFAPNNPFPQYNRNVYVLAHEIGHLLGCAHTFECAWGPSGDKAIDNCSGFGFVVPCPGAPPPTNGGTIMGYCTNFSLLNGFGPEPRQRMLDYISSAPCLQTEAYYAACVLDSMVLTTECLPDANTVVKTDNQTRLKGTVYGTSGGSYELTMLYANMGTPVQPVKTLPYNTLQVLGDWHSYRGPISVTFKDLSNPACTVTDTLYPSYDVCSSANVCLSTAWTKSLPTNYPFRRGADKVFVNIKKHPLSGYVLVENAWKDRKFVGNDSSEFKIYRLDNSGNVLWQRTFPNCLRDTLQSEPINIPEFVILPNGDMVFAFTKRGPSGAHFLDSYGQMAVTRLDNNGNTIWEKMPILEGVLKYYSGVTLNGVGNLLVYGRSFIGQTFGLIGSILEMDLNGQVIAIATVGGPNYLEAASLHKALPATNGGFFVGGHKGIYPYLENTQYNLVKFASTSNNQKIWEKTYAFSPTYSRLEFVNMIPNSVGGVLMIGYNRPPQNANNDFYANDYFSIYLVNTDSAGVVLWTKTITEATFNNAVLYNGVLEADGSFTLFGRSDGNTQYSYGELPLTPWHSWVMRLAADGTFQWQKSYKGTQGASGDFAHDGGYILVGYGSEGPRNFSDSNNPTLQIRKTTPSRCDTAPVPPPTTCALSASVSNIVCNNNGTPSITTDDKYGFSLTVSGTNTGASGWKTTIAGQNYTGSFGTALAVSGLSIASGALTLTITDVQKSTCITTVSVTPPSPCSTPVAPTPCPSTSANPWQEWIARVKIVTIDKSSGKSVYSDFKTLSTTLAAGSIVPITLSTGFSFTTYDEYWRIWIDLDGDGALHETNELVYQGKLNKPANGAGIHPLSGQLTIPASATAGSRLMRVSMKRGSYATPCETLPYGEVEDFTAIISGGSGGACSLTASASNKLCSDAGTPSIATDDKYSFSLLVSASGVSGSEGWTTTANGQTVSGQYNIAQTISNLLIANGNLSLTIRDAANAACNTQITVTPPATCSGVVPPPPSPCTVASAAPWSEWIGGVQIGVTSHTSEKSTYSNFLGKNFVVMKGQANTLTLTGVYSYTTYPEYWRVWIDYNKDGIYDAQTEMAYEGIMSPPPAANKVRKNLIGSFTVPTTALGNQTTMRVSMKRNSYPLPCENVNFGEIEDYTMVYASGYQAGTEQNAFNWDNQTDEVVIYPNPTDNILYVKWNTVDGARLQLYNMLGQKVQTEESTSKEATLELSGLAEGVYILQIEQVGKRVVNRRVVLVR